MSTIVVMGADGFVQGRLNTVAPNDIMRRIELGKTSQIAEEDVFLYEKGAMNPADVQSLRQHFGEAHYNMVVLYRRGELEEEANESGMTGLELIAQRKLALFNGPKI